jgi:hypothetical protein
VWFRVLFLLMNKDTKWLLFDCYEDEFGFVAGKEIEWYTESRPIGYDNIGDFLDARKAPKHRKHIAELLKKYGCESIENFLKLTHALSLNDTFWVKQPESTLSWNDVSLYRNEFDELVSNAAFDGVISSTTLSSTSPEFGTDGAYAKCWQRENGKVYLYKSGSDTYEIEPLSEFLTTQVADILCRDNAQYELTFYHGRLASKCELFTNEQFGLVKMAALPVSNRRNPAAFLKFAEQYGSEDLMRRMFVLDALILNIDRHLGNVGFLFDNDTMRIESMAPVYDNNRSLLFQFDTEALEKNQAWCISKCEPRVGGDFIKTAQAMLTDDLRAELKNMAGFRFKEPENIDVPKDRLDALSKIFNLQLNKILK